MMRICQIMLARGFGGAERYFVDLCGELARRGHDVLAVCHPAGMARARLPALPRLRIAPLRTFGPWDPVAPRRLRRLLAGCRPAAVHAHLARAAHVAGRAVRGSGPPLIVKTHNYVDLRYYRDVTLFLPTTRDQAAYLARHGVAPQRIRVIPNFSALPAASLPAGRPPAIVAMGRFVEKKGFDVLLAALAQLRRRGIALPPVLLGGDGPLRAELEALSRRLGLADLVQFGGWQADAAAFLDRGTLFVLPSLDEPFGIAVLEAMARGVPVIATRTQGPREVLDENTAWLVPPGDRDALAVAIADALCRPDEARARATRAGAAFRGRYAADAVVPELIAVYGAVSAGAEHAGVTEPGQHGGHR
jgi:glycosyltransferase involved in cell wall biosynthesis